MNVTHEKKLYKSGKILYKKLKLDSYHGYMKSGFRCGDGWFKPLKKLTIKLEELNKKLRFYKLNIEAEQVKEKFGRLHFYFNLNDKYLFNEINVDFKLNKNTIEYVKKNNKTYFCKYFIVKKISFIFNFYNKIINIINFIYLKLKKDVTKEDQKKYYMQVDELIKETEKECYNICEICGCSESEDNKIIETTGWIRRICKKCNKQREAKSCIM